jgi:hypothetical protein
MNHSSFLDAKIAVRLLGKRPFHIVCTTDAYLGKSLLMRLLGCIPTKKFVPDLQLLRDMDYTLRTLRESVLLFPEAGYSLDGTATTLPDTLGHLVKRSGVPLVMIRTRGAFLRDPLYNELRKRRLPVSADMTCLLTREEVAAATPEELNRIVHEAFCLDNFRWQQEDGVEIAEPFRATGLHRVLYRCPACRAEGQTVGEGTTLTCRACGKVYELTPQGRLCARDGHTEIDHVPDWYRWERDCVRDELESGSYRLEIAVRVGMLIDYKRLYWVGNARLTHDREGFRLTGIPGTASDGLDFLQKPQYSYSINADFYWYELGDVICIGDTSKFFYCFPESTDVPVAKARLAAEELYRMTRTRTQRGPGSH